jgi:hypothetical protein
MTTPVWVPFTLETVVEVILANEGLFEDGYSWEWVSAWGPEIGTDDDFVGAVVMAAITFVRDRTDLGPWVLWGMRIDYDIGEGEYPGELTPSSVWPNLDPWEEWDQFGPSGRKPLRKTDPRWIEHLDRIQKWWAQEQLISIAVPPDVVDEITLLRQAYPRRWTKIVMALAFPGENSPVALADYRRAIPG